jgi:hypothetical protein
VPKLVQKLARKEGRGENAPALPRLKARFMRLGRPANRGALSAGTGVVAAAVVVVSLLTWLAPDSDRPVPLELVDRVLPGVAEQVEEQAAALIEGGKEVAQSAARNVREGVLGAGLRAAQDGIPASLSALSLPAVLPTPSSTPTSLSSEKPSAPSEPSAPAMDSSLPATTSEPSTPLTEAPPTGAPPATSEPVTPSPIAEKPPEEPPPPAAEEPAPPAEEPAPPAEEPGPPAAEEPGPPAAEEPPITETQPPAPGEPLTGAPG